MATTLYPTDQVRMADLAAGFWIRFRAALVDDLITVAVAFLAVWQFGFTPATQLVVIVFAFVYHAVLDGRGGTLGKRLLGIEVVNEAGEAPGLVAGIVRTLIPVGLGGLANMVGSLGFVLTMFVLGDALSMIRHPNKQTLHDRVAGTFVVGD